MADKVRAQNLAFHLGKFRGVDGYGDKLTTRRLTSMRLPETLKLRLLMEQYFKHLHPLRCFAFIHKPSFMQWIDDEMVADHNENALVCIISALGARPASP